MKKIILMALCACAAMFTACDKDSAEDILALLKDNQVSFNGSVYDAQGYVGAEGDTWCIADFGAESGEFFAHGYVQGEFLGKTIDLANPKCDDFQLYFSCGNKEQMYNVQLSVEGGKATYMVDDGSNSSASMSRPDTKEGSCFKSGTASAKVSGKNLVINVAGTLVDGKTFGLKISQPLERQEQ